MWLEKLRQGTALRLAPFSKDRLIQEIGSEKNGQERHAEDYRLTIYR